MRLIASRILFFSALSLTPALMLAQTTSTVTGVVTDPSGAVIPGAVVTLSNPSRGLKFEVKTNSVGSYLVPNVPPGPGYQLDFAYPGFSPSEVKGLYVNVANSRTQNAKLTPGSTVEVKVTTNTGGVSLDTTDATVGNNFEVSKLNNLPVYDRSSPSALFTLQPGITTGGATTGAREDQTDTTVDGLDVNDFATGSFKAITGNAPIDSIQEFRGTTAGFTADSGPSGGGQFQLVTNSGSDKWHGNVNEYHRDNSTAANDWFNDEIGATAGKLVQNQFGGSVGGPIKHDKAFFFFDYLNSRIASDSTETRTVPLPSYTAGNISYLNDNPGCTDSARQNTDPGCISSLTPAQAQALDPAGVGESPQVYDLYKNIYPAANDVTGGDGINTGLFRFNAPTPDDKTVYVGRVDWILTPTIKLYGVGSFSRENSFQSAEQFPGQPIAGQFVDRSYRYVGGMDWQISPTRFNEFAYGTTVQDYAFPRASNPEGIYQIGFASGVTTLIDSPYSSPSNAQSRHVPIPQVSDQFSWTLGRHNLSFGGYFKWILATDQTELGYNSYAIGLGGEVQGLGSSLEPGNILPNDSTAQVTFDSAYASALGRVGDVSSTFNYDAAGNVLAQPSSSTQSYRYYQTQPYFMDNWKLTPHLTVTYGLNYQYFSVPYEVHGLQTVQNMGFDKFFAAREAQSAAGLSGANAVPFFTYVLGGKANNGPAFYKATPLNFAPRVAFAYNPGFDPSTVFSGSAGIVYDRTIINAVQYQQTQYSYLFEQNKTVNNGDGTNPVGSLQSDPRLANPPLAVAPVSPKAPYQPYISGGLPIGLQNGGAFNEMIDPNLKTPYSILINFGMQHQFPFSTILKVNYVGRLGRRLLAQADTQQLIDFKDPASGQMMSQAMAHITQEVRAGKDPNNLPAEPWWENQLGPGTGQANGFPNNTSLVSGALESLVEKGDFADTIQALSGLLDYNVGMGAQFSENTMYTNKGFSAYNGLLVTVSKNLSHGLQFDFNYTWSHSVDNVSIIANSVAYGGYGFICDAVHPRECRGNSDFDTTHYISSDLTYSLPFGRGRTFGAKLPLALDELVGGWDVSAIPRWNSGAAYSTVSSAFVAGYANEAPAIFNGDTAALKHRTHKDSSGAVFLYDNPQAAVSTFTGPVGLTIGSRNNLRGPNLFNVDAGLAKNFILYPEKGVHLQFRADAFNVLNHPNFSTPGTETSADDITQPSSFGQMTSLVANAGSLGGPRVLQLSGRIEF